jgi:predicted DNA-binding transcriptional regulator AlpA
MAKSKPQARLLTHRSIARLCDVDTETIREWVARGEWPEPHAIVERTWFFAKSVVDYWLETGRWPEGTKFKAGSGKGRQA